MGSNITWLHGNRPEAKQLDWKDKRTAQRVIGEIISDTITGRLNWTPDGRRAALNDVTHKDHSFIVMGFTGEHLYSSLHRVTFWLHPDTPWTKNLFEVLADAIKDARAAREEIERIERYLKENKQ